MSLRSAPILATSWDSNPSHSSKEVDLTRWACVALLSKPPRCQLFSIVNRCFEKTIVLYEGMHFFFGNLPQKTCTTMPFPVHEGGLIKAVVKGAGPASLAAAAALAQAGLCLVAGKGASRPRGHGRKNMMALRPEALRRVDNLGAPQDLLTVDEHGNPGFITAIQKVEPQAKLVYVFKWPLLRYPSAE